MRRGYGKGKTRRNFPSNRPVARHRKKKGVEMMAKILRPKIYSFKREHETVLNLSQVAPPEGWSVIDDSIYKNLGWSLSTLGNHAEFQALFKQYRLIGARLRFYASNTVAGEDGGQFGNHQLMLRMAPNFSGKNTTLDAAFWAQAQAKKYYTLINGGKPIDVYMPLYQENEITSSTGTANVFTKPKFVPTDQDNVVHYGQSVAINRVDGQAFTTGSNNTQYVRMITTLYFQTRAVV